MTTRRATYSPGIAGKRLTEEAPNLLIGPKTPVRRKETGVDRTFLEFLSL
jgi:hypothetical protein